MQCAEQRQRKAGLPHDGVQAAAENTLYIVVFHWLYDPRQQRWKAQNVYLFPPRGQRCAVGQAGADLHLCLQYILARAEIFQMRNTDHRDDARAGPGTAGQTLDLARVVHAHLDNGVLGVVGQAEQRVGHADVIVSGCPLS